MALNIKITQEVLNSGESLIFTDETGVYSVNNEGGWGLPNKERVNHAILFYVKRLPYNKDPEILSLSNSFVDYNSAYTDSTQSSFTIDYKDDGWYQTYFIVLPIDYTTPEANDIKYNTSTETIEKYNGTVWETFNIETEGSEDLLLGGDYEFGFVEEIFQLNLIEQKNCSTVNYIDCLQCNTCKCDKYFEDTSKLYILIQSIDYIFWSNKKYEAVKTLEKANKEFNCCK